MKSGIGEGLDDKELSRLGHRLLSIFRKGKQGRKRRGRERGITVITLPRPVFDVRPGCH